MTGQWTSRLLAVAAVSVLLYFGNTLFVPLCYGLLIAIVLYPVCRWLEEKGWPRSLAIASGLLIVITLFVALLSLLVIEFNLFRKDIPELLARAKPALIDLQLWITDQFGLSADEQQQWWQQTTQQVSSNAGAIAQSTISATAGLLFTLFLVPVYAALFLYNREVFVQFVVKITSSKVAVPVKDILHKVIHTYFSFIKGMLLVYLIVGILNSIGLLALGIRHAVLFGMLTAIMTIIPYIGIIISALLPISVAWITKDSIWYPIGVTAVFAFVQYLEANVIFPKIVATQLNVSTWATLVAIIAGGILWGVSGMILFIPFIGILKIILDDVPEWGVWNILVRREKI